MDFGVIEDVRQISVRIRDHSPRTRTSARFDLKRGRGGIREVEFFVQIQQMIHGGRDRRSASRQHSTPLPHWKRLGTSTLRRRKGSATPIACFATVEHRVQMVDDAQTHLLPADSDALDNVARLMASPTAKG